MDGLIADSISILKDDPKLLDIIYAWTDIGDLLCEKQRTNKLTSDWADLIDDLTTLIEKVKTQNEIKVYRGLTIEPGVVFEAPQFNSVSPSIETAKTYGDYIMTIFIPKDCNAFYISAWEFMNPNVPSQDEKEIILPPGKFVLKGEYYMYQQSLQ
jgi:hypothetical protein